jgi:hypothetical protein
MVQSVIARSFAGGELSPALAARADLAKYQSGGRVIRNFVVQRHGGVANRPGTRFVAAAKFVNSRVMYLRYVSEVPGQSVLIEAGDLYLRFFVAGAPVRVSAVPAWGAGTLYQPGDLVALDDVYYYATANSVDVPPPNSANWYALPGDLYEIPHPFPAPNLFRWAQSGSVITLTHPDLPPQELIFSALTRWTVSPITTRPAINPPENVHGTESGDSDNQRFRYVVTAADKDTYEESEPSAPWDIFRQLGPKKSEPFTIIFDPVPNAAEYYIYGDFYKNGIYGFLATLVWDGTLFVPENEFHDIGFPPDFSQTPPIAVRLFETVGSYPAMAAYFQQRRWFANSRNEPETVWGSRIAFPRNFGISSPLQDDDALTFRVSGEQRHPVQHLIGVGPLVLLTDRGEWIVQGSGDGPLMPTSLQADQFGYHGASPAVPVVIGKTIIFVQTRGRIVRDLQLDPSSGGLNGRDLTLYAGHLFDGYTISKLDYAENPHSTVWAVRSDGLLLGLTYVPDADVWGWHRHDSGASAVFEDVCVVPELDEDVVYLLVTRTINGAAVRYLERFASRLVLSLSEAFFVDAGLSYRGTPVSSVSGLDHLEGELVAVVADGVVLFNGDPAASTAETFRVTGGALTLPVAASVIHAGLPIRYAEIETLDLDVAGSSVRDKRKRVQSLTLIVEKSVRSFVAGPDRDHLLPPGREVWEPTGLVDDTFFVNITAAFNNRGSTVIRQTEPLPLTILGLIPQIEAAA